MLLNVNVEDIIDGLRKASNVVPAKSGAVYLRALWLSADSDYLTIMSTDTALEFTGKYPAAISDSGLAGINGKQFTDLMNRMRGGTITLKLEDGNALSIEKGKKIKYALPVSDVTWFQKLEEFPRENAVQWSGDFLSDAINKTLFSVDDEGNEDAISCLYMGVNGPKENQTIDICGLNGHQFAIYHFIHDSLASIMPEGGILIQKKYVNELLRWLPKNDIEVSITSKRLFISTGDESECLSIPRTLLTYPNYNTFMSRLDTPDFSLLTINKQELKEALERLSVFCVDGRRFAIFNLSENELSLSVYGQNDAKGVETIEINYNSPIKKIGFPVKDVIAILDHFESDEVSFKMTPNDGPCGITGKDDPDYEVLIMPMRSMDDDYYEDDDEEEEEEYESDDSEDDSDSHDDSDNE